MKKKRLMITLLLLITVFMFIGFAYAYLASGISNANRQEATITTGTMNLTFADGSTTLAETEMTIGTSVTKTFTIENTGTLDATASMYFKDLVNTYMADSMSYRLEYATSENGTYSVLQAETNVPQSSTVSEKLLYGNITVPAGTKLYYKLIITFNNLPNVDQTADVNAVLNTKFTLKAGHTIESESDITLATLGLSANSGTPDFSQMPPGESGIYSAPDSYGTSYYFRGNVTNNYVKFAKYLDSIYYYYPAGTGQSTLVFNTEKTECEKYLGDEIQYECESWPSNGKDMYWRIIRINGDGSVRMIYDGTQIYENGVFNTDRFAIPSTYYIAAGIEIENWDNVTTLTSTMSSYIVPELFNTSIGDPDLSSYEGFDNLYYPVYTRIPEYNPTLLGKTYTWEEQIFSNITADEVMFAGGAVENTYLSKGALYVTDSIRYYEPDSGQITSYYSDLDPSHDYYTDVYIAPVITITKEAAQSLIGTGTPGDPFRLS